MRPLFGRALGAALLLSLVPSAAAGQSFAERFPAIATGLGIPTGSDIPGATEAANGGRYVLVDAASARLFMVEDGRVVDSMKVVVGKPGSQTPTLKSTLLAATLNPYWNVPPDLAQKIIAPRVLEDGLSYLEERGYEVVSGFAGDVSRIPAESVDWQSVADGTTLVYVRQLPGPGNSMGEVKFTIHNGNGIFLHDTPNKDLFEKDRRYFSNGCVRLEDAARLARWLFGGEPRMASAAPEQHVPLPRPVPIVITRLDETMATDLAALH